MLTSATTDDQNARAHGLRRAGKDDALITRGADTDEAHAHSGELLDEPHVGLRRVGEILEAGRTDHIVLQIPVGDMTFDEAKRTMDVFCSDVKPELEAAA